MTTVWRILGWSTGIAVLLALSAFVTHQFSPWPSAMVYRVAMDAGGFGSAASMGRHVPDGIRSKLDQRYEMSYRDSTFDVYYPARVETTKESLTTIVWVHGGGFISGDKGQVANYLKVLASHGYTVVGVNYTLAPRLKYPNPVHQVGWALGTVAREGSALHADPRRIVLAGDSAGAQIAAQVAAVISSPDYAKQVGASPSIARLQLIGAILHCGIYDFTRLDTEGPLGGFLRSAGWSYFGTKDFKGLPAVAQASIVNHVTPEFPPTFISAGNADPLLPQSLAMAEALEKQGVAVDRLFFPADTKQRLGHEYQFNLDTDAGKLALERALKFLKAR